LKAAVEPAAFFIRGFEIGRERIAIPEIEEPAQPAH